MKVQDNSIIKLLGIKDKHVVLWDSGENKEGYWFEIHTKIKRQKCPACKERTRKVHNYRTQPVKSTKKHGKPVTLYVKKRRYKCSCAKTFYECLLFLERYQHQQL